MTPDVNVLLAVQGVEIAELGREWPALRRLLRDHSTRGFLRLLGRTELTLLSPR